MENNIFELQYAMDTFYFLVSGALVMWMAAGFAMLESGLVRAKNTTEILTKNVALFAIACIMYMICGYAIMYGGEFFLAGMGDVDADAVLGDFAAREDGFRGGSIYSGASDFFFQVVFVATAMSIVSGAVAERMKLWAFLLFAIVMTGFIYPMEGNWTWGGGSVFGMFSLGDDFGFSDFAGSGIVHMAGASAPSLVSCCSAHERANTPPMARSTPSRVPTCRLPRSVPSSCGWVGSASTAVRC
jgi:Amt family ammonium transporter